MRTDTVITKGIEMSYFSFGEGERAFVILPGIGIKSVLTAAKAIEAAYRGLAGNHTVYVFDRRRNLPEKYSVREMAADTAAVMRELGISDADVFGASQGGMMAQYLAANDPDLVHTLVLGSTSAYGNDVICATVKSWTGYARARDLTGLTADFIDRLYSENTIKQYRDFLIHMNDNVSDEELDRFIILAETIYDFDARSVADRIQCPTLVIGVEDDLAVGGDASREIADLLGCELYMYGNEYGHCVFDEAPDYKQRLTEFFDKHR